MCVDIQDVNISTITISKPPACPHLTQRWEEVQTALPYIINSIPTLQMQ